jgi:hypothetical protein
MIHWKKFFLVFFLVSIFSAIIYITTYKPYLGCDDAYIYFVYVKNFTRGFGFVYNPGGEHVEGFTSLLWVLITSLIYLISSHFQVLLIILNIILVSLALYKMVLFIDKYFAITPSKIISVNSLLFLCILFIIKGYLDWSVFSLLETGLWSCLLILLSVYLLEVAAGEIKNKSQILSFSLLIGLLIITRPESLLWGLLFIVIYGLLIYRQTLSIKNTFRLIATPLAFYAIFIIALISFRLSYFGYPFPNTYYAKVSSDRIYNIKEGLIYIFKFVYVYPFYFISITTGIIYTINLVYLAVKRKQRLIDLQPLEVIQNVICLFIVISLLIPVINGGDHFSLFRLFQPVAPLLILPFFNPVFISTIKSVSFNRESISGSILRAFVLLAFIYLMNMPKYLINVEKTPYKVSLLNDFSFASEYKKESLKLNNFFDFDPKPSIGRIWAGAYAFAYNGPTVDLMGLNNTIMAHAEAKKVGLKNHAAFNKEAFYKLSPDFLNGTVVKDTSKFSLPENSADFVNGFEYSVFKGIYKDQRFIQSYTPAIISRAGDSFFYFTYVRNDYIDSLKAHNLHVTIMKRAQNE